MEYVNEVWRTDLYKLQQQAPSAKPILCQTPLQFRPPHYGAEFHGNVNRDKVERLMSNQLSGSYLIRCGMRTPGTYTLVIKFDDQLKNYKLFYDAASRQHYVGLKFFDRVNDLVQDGLIHLYIESRGALELKKIAESNIYEESPFFKSRYYTLQINRQKPIGTNFNRHNANQQHHNENNSNNNNHSQRHHHRQKEKQNVENIDSPRINHQDNSNTTVAKNVNSVNDSSILQIDEAQLERNKNNPFYSKEEIKTTSNNPFLNCGEIIEEAEPSICPPIRHSSLISSQLARQKLNHQRQLSTSSTQIMTESSSTTATTNTNTDILTEDSLSSDASLDNIRHSSASRPIISANTTVCVSDSVDMNVSVTTTAPLMNSSFLGATKSVAGPPQPTMVSSFAFAPSIAAAVSAPTVAVSKSANLTDETKPHNFKTNTFRGPHWCDFCTHFMWGLVAQGVKCQDCGFQAHRKCSDRVPQDCLPDMKRLKRIFGVELTSLGKAENRAVPWLLTKLLSIVEARGVETEGIYRVSGNTEIVELVKAEIDKDIDSVDLDNDPRLSEIHNVTGLVKLFFRQLPIPLVTLEISSVLIDTIKSEDKAVDRLDKYKETLLRLPSVHYATLNYLLNHLFRLTGMSRQNKMTIENLAIIFAPSLISHNPVPIGVAPSVGLSPLNIQEIIHRTLQSNVELVEDLIRYYTYLFNEENQ